MRRDVKKNTAMQKYIEQMVKLQARQSGRSLNEDAVREAYLKKLGIKPKAATKAQSRIWHLDHVKAGTAYRGFLEHPKLNGGSRFAVEVKIESPTTGRIESQSVPDLNAPVTIEQDFPIESERGEKRTQDILAYTFSKFNPLWRDFDTPMPADIDLEHITLKGLRIFFKQTAQVDDFPSKADFESYAQESPEKGMSKVEFLAWLGQDNPNYLEETLVGFFTGRRIRMQSEDLLIDGDFQVEPPGLIAGFADFDNEGGGAFALTLVGKD